LEGGLTGLGLGQIPSNLTTKRPRPKPFKSIDARPSSDTMIKPGELIDIVEMSPLTLTDRRIYNMLIATAWDRIEKPVTHVIAKRELRGSRDANDRVGESVERLMAAIARLQIERNGKLYIRRVQLLGATDEGTDDDGLLHFCFPPELRAIIRESSVFARLRRDVIFALSSKYALCLYETLQKRGNLGFKWSDEFDLERFRQILGVDPGKLTSFKNFNKWAIQPAVLEVNRLSDYSCRIEPVLSGRKATGIRLSWWRKDTDELKAVYRELQAAKVGRRARLKGTVDRIIANGGFPLPGRNPAHDSQPTSLANNKCRQSRRPVRVACRQNPATQPHTPKNLPLFEVSACLISLAQYTCFSERHARQKCAPISKCGWHAATGRSGIRLGKHSLPQCS
jgi:Initiator Rep protein, WH2/Initiator Replication protein, WH1